VIAALLLLPTLAGIAAFVLRADRMRRTLLLIAATAHLALVAACWAARPAAAARGWMALDAAGLLFLTVTSVLFLAASAYAVGYLAREVHAPRADFEEGTLFDNGPEAIFTGCLLLFLATMTLVTVSQHLGLLWVAVEATTLASAPLIHFHRHHRSLEATWKYLLVCSVGIALALLGTFVLAVAAAQPGGGEASMVLARMVAAAASFDHAWLKIAFVFVLVGYGTKMGLAPLHTWLPDAHAESPSVASALLSGALLNCAFLAVLRAHTVLAAAGLGEFSGELLRALGLFSMAVAAVFILGQSDYKRMLAYSSVEHMGILALGVGLGAAGSFGALLHAVNHSVVKAMLFLLAGNVLAAYHTKATGEVRGVGRALPVTGALWLAGLLAITGAPPFGPFVSELAIARAAADGGRFAVLALYLLFLALAFVGMGRIMVAMAQGPPPEGLAGAAEPRAAVLPAAALAALSLLLGVAPPAALVAVIREAARALGVV
jgi:hydrogenase-4 component F